MKYRTPAFIFLVVFSLLISQEASSAEPATKYVIDQVGYNHRVDLNASQAITGKVNAQGTSEPAPNGTWVYILQNNTVLSLSMDEGKDIQTYDLSGFRNNVTFDGGSWTGGRYGSAISFNGLNDYLMVQNSPYICPGEALTVEAWVFTRNFTKNGNTIKGSWISKRESYQLYPETTGSVEFGLWINGIWRYTLSPPYSISLNTWQHWVGTYDGSTVRLYRNGILLDERTYPAGTIGNSGDLYIGWQHPYPDRRFDGIIDEVRIYDRALSVEEVQAHYISRMSGYTNANGEFSISNFYIPSVLGNKYRYTVTSEFNVGNKTFEMFSDRISVSAYGTDDSMINTGSEGTVWFKLHSEYDHSPITSGSVILNNSYAMSWNSAKERWEYQPILTSPGRRTYYISDVNWDLYNLTGLNPGVSSNRTSIIWNRVEVTIQVSKPRVNVGENITVTYSAKYGYDNSTFNGLITLNSSVFQYDTVGRRGYTAQPTIDPLYNLSSFTSNTAYCIWDRIIVAVAVSPSNVTVNEYATVKVSLWREYDGSNLTDFSYTIRRNETDFKNPHVKYTFTDVRNTRGSWVYDFTSVKDNTYGLTVFVDPPNLTLTWGEKQVSDNFTLYIVTAAVIAALLLFALIIIWRRAPHGLSRHQLFGLFLIEKESLNEFLLSLGLEPEYLNTIKRHIAETPGSPFIICFQILLGVCVALLALNDIALANNIAVYAYLALATGVVLQLLAFVWHRKKGASRI